MNEVKLIRWERRAVHILKNLKLAGYDKNYCQTRFTPQLVNKHWDNL